MNRIYLNKEFFKLANFYFTHLCCLEISWLNSLLNCSFLISVLDLKMLFTFIIITMSLLCKDLSLSVEFEVVLVQNWWLSHQRLKNTAWKLIFHANHQNSGGYIQKWIYPHNFIFSYSHVQSFNSLQFFCTHQSHEPYPYRAGVAIRKYHYALLLSSPQNILLVDLVSIAALLRFAYRPPGSTIRNVYIAFSVFKVQAPSVFIPLSTCILYIVHCFNKTNWQSE